MAEAKHKVTYAVTKQELSTRYNSDGTHEPVWTVHLLHADGTKGQVVVPDTHYSAENVHMMAQHQADTVAQVAALGNGQAPAE